MGLAGSLAVWLLCLGLLAPPALAGWGRPFQLAGPGSLDELPATLAFSAGGNAAVVFGIADVDTPGVSQGYLAIRTVRGEIAGPRSIPGAARILAVTYDRSFLELLIGVAPPGLTCCSSVEAVQLTSEGGLTRPRTVVAGLSGDTVAQLLALADGRMLAAVATERGVWEAQATPAGRFSPARLLTSASQSPEAMSAAWLGAESTAIAWTAGAGTAGATDPRTVSLAGPTAAGLPRAVRTAVTLPPGYRIDELAIARHGTGVTAAWIASWFDSMGAYHSQVQAADLTRHPRVRTLSSPALLASGLGFAADTTGDQGLSWQSCAPAPASAPVPTCAVEVALRGAGQSFGTPSSLGAVDPGQEPAIAIGSLGEAIVGWIQGGRPVAASTNGPGAVFGAPVVLSPTTYALDLTVAAGPGRRALAVWTQGTLNPSVVGVPYSAP